MAHAGKNASGYVLRRHVAGAVTGQPQPWAEQWAALTRFAAAQQPDPSGEALGEIGLLLTGVGRYPATAQAVQPLLRSGVDGVHWGALPTSSPFGYVMVMTVPAAGEPGVVVGESLVELLGLGCETGFHSLDRLTHDRASALPRAEPAANPLLARLRRALGLRPWPDVPTRLAVLAERYGPLVRVPSERGNRAGDAALEEMHERIAHEARDASRALRS